MNASALHPAPRSLRRMLPMVVAAILVAARLYQFPAAAMAPGELSPVPGKAREARERVLDVTLVPSSAAAPPAVATPAPNAAPAGKAGAPLSDARADRAQPAPGAPGKPSHTLPIVLTAIAAVAAGAFAWRRRPRRCTNCSARMRRLTGAAALGELDMGERTDQLVGDVRYTVWRCGACGAVEKQAAAHEVLDAASAAPVGSAQFVRRRPQLGMSIWSPPTPIISPAGAMSPAAAARPATPSAPAVPQPSPRAGDEPE